MMTLINLKVINRIEEASRNFRKVIINQGTINQRQVFIITDQGNKAGNFHNQATCKVALLAICIKILIYHIQKLISLKIIEDQA